MSNENEKHPFWDEPSQVSAWIGVGIVYLLICIGILGAGLMPRCWHGLIIGWICFFWQPGMIQGEYKRKARRAARKEAENEERNR